MKSPTVNIRAVAEPGDSPVDRFEGRDGGSPTFREVFAAEESPLLRFGYGLTGDRETAEDIVQDAFLKLHTHWDDVSNPRAWLFRCVRNLALNHIRDTRKETMSENDDEWESQQPDPDETVARMEAVGTLRMLVAELQPSERALVSLKYHEDLKYEQIAERTGLGVGNVGYKLHHVLKGLADAMRRMGVESAGG